jgi:thiol-disulfide isomerase/thioredoxin
MNEHTKIRCKGLFSGQIKNDMRQREGKFCRLLGSEINLPLSLKFIFMKSRAFVAAFVIFLSMTAHAQPSPQSADEILKGACQQAGKENKNVFLMFHASWCGWCRKMEASLKDETCKQLFEDNYVIKYLTVFESKGKENLENPGALALLAKYKGSDYGIPYWLIFDKDGNLVEDSKSRPDGITSLDAGENIGCPANEEEVDHFIHKLQNSSKLKPEQLAIIKKRFRQNE